MTNVVPLRAVVPPYEAFCIARREMLRTWQAWLLTRPDPHDIAEELHAIESALRQVGMMMP